MFFWSTHSGAEVDLFWKHGGKNYAAEFKFADAPKTTKSIIDSLIKAEFAAVALLISAGAVLGRIKMGQYIQLGLLFIPFYMLNEWILLSGGLGLVPANVFTDTGGSIVIHAFGALFGLGIIFNMTTKKEFKTPIESDAVSDRFSMLGSMVLWIFWTSFCAALVPEAQIPATVLNVILALSGATIATYFASVFFRKKYLLRILPMLL